MSSVNDKIRNTDNLMVQVQVSENKVNKEFIANVVGTLFDPEKFIPNGGPVTKKSISAQAIGKNHDEARSKALDLAADLLGL